MTNLSNISTTWIDTAEDRAENMHNPKVFIGGGLASGLILGSLLNPLTGLASLAYGLYLAWVANERNSDQIEAVEDGLVAHLLDKKQLYKYQADVGEERVKWELGQAIKRELKLSEPAQAMAHSLGLMGNTPAFTLPRLRLGSGKGNTETASSGESLTPPQDSDLLQNCQPALTPSNADDAGDASPPVETVNGGDDGSQDVALTSEINSEDAHTVTGSYGFDKLKGISLKQFREMLRAQGVTHENGSFRSVDAIDLPSSEQFVRRRLEGFWQEFHSKKVNHAVYFVFGLQNGGGRSQEATDRFNRAKQYVDDWFTLYVDGENLPEVEPF